MYRGLTGGTATVAARADFSKVDDPKLPFVPDVEVDARDVPVNALLINCLPESEQLTQGGSLHAMLTELNAAGLIDCGVRMGMQDGNEPYFRVETGLQSLMARPHALDKPARLILSKMTGQVVVTDEELRVGVRAEASPADGSRDPAPATVRFSMPISAQISDLSTKPPKPLDQQQGMKLEAAADELESSLPVEDLVSIFTPGAGKNLAELRAKFEPFGTVNVKVVATQPPGGGRDDDGGADEPAQGL